MKRDFIEFFLTIYTLCYILSFFVKRNRKVSPIGPKSKISFLITTYSIYTAIYICMLGGRFI
jgi:hypothetical protein